MAKKKLNPLEDPPTASSREEDKVETLSGEDEEEISDDSSSEEEDNLMNPVSIPPAGSKKPIKEKELCGTSPAVKSAKKRPSESTSSKEVNAKRSKSVSEETTKPSLFQRVWSEEDEISLLQGMIDYKAETGDSPYDDTDSFYEFTRKAISFEASKNQFFDKIRSLKKKYKGKMEKGVESLKKAHDIECFKLFECIWGSNGIALESAVKSGVKKTEKKKVVKPHGKDVEEVVGFESPAKSDGTTEKTEKKKLVKPHGKDVEAEVVALESAAKSNVTPKKSKKKPISLEANGDNVEDDREVLVNVEEDKEVLVSGEKVEEDRVVLVNGEKVEEDREVLVNGEKVEEDKEVLVNGGVSKSLGVKGYDWFENSFLVGSIASLGVTVSEQFVKQKWSIVGVETKKRMEEKWKLLQAREMELVLLKTDFMREVGSVIAEAS